MEKEKQEDNLLVEILEAKFLGELMTAIRLYKEQWANDKHRGKVSSPKFVDGTWTAEASRLV